MGIKLCAIAATLALVAAASVQANGTPAGDPAAGEVKSRTCHACHGSDGLSINDMWPNLAAQKEGYLRKQITAFRDSTRVEPTMIPFVQGLTDQDIADISAYFSSLSGEPAAMPDRH